MLATEKQDWALPAMVIGLRRRGRGEICGEISGEICNEICDEDGGRLDACDVDSKL